MGKPQQKYTPKEQKEMATKLFSDFRAEAITFADFVAGAIKQNLTTHNALKKADIKHEAISKARSGGPTDVPKPIREAFLKTFCSSHKVPYMPRTTQPPSAKMTQKGLRPDNHAPSA